MVKKYLTKGNILLIIFFGLFLMYGLCTFNDYSLSLDEDIERTTGLINYRYVFPNDADGVKGTVDFSALPELSEWRDRYYGSAAQYIPLLAERLFGFEMEYHRVFQIRHLFTFLLFWLACVCFFFLCRLLGRDRTEALVGTGFLILSPRILADSFYNIKDSVFLSLIVINLLTGVLFLRRPDVWRGILLALVSAVCINVRILGGEVLALCLIAFLVRGVREKQAVRHGVAAALTGVAAFLFYIFITPVTWSDVIGAVRGILLTFSDYTSWTGYNFYGGEALRAWELPWHYIPVWIMATTPILYIVLAVIGCAGLRKRGEGMTAEKWIIAGYVLIPLLYAVLRRPSLYNGWRHFYFVYPGIILAATAGWGWIAGWAKKYSYGLIVLSGLTAVYLGIVGVWILKNHPFECVYFNRIFRGYAEANLEKDYWYMAQYEALQWVGMNDQREEVTVCGGPVSYLPEGTMKQRLHYAGWESADYVIYSNVLGDEGERFDGKVLRVLRGEAEFQFDGLDLCDEIYCIRVDGMKICTVYRRTHNKTAGSQLRYENGELRFDSNGIGWIQEHQDSCICFEGLLESPCRANRIGIQMNQPILPVRAAFSSDGISWIEYNAECWQKIGESRVQLNFESQEIRFIRIYYPLTFYESKEDLQISVGLYEKADEGNIWRDTPAGIASVAATENLNEQSFAIDGDLSTRWSSGIAQRPGIAYEVELEQERRVGGITLNSGIYEEDYARGIKLYGSLDGESWTEIPAQELEKGYYSFAPAPLRYIRCVLTQGCSWNWSICEVKIWLVP